MNRADSSRRRQPAPKLSREAMERAALTYLERYASSAANLRRVLNRRIRRAERQGATDVEAARALIDEIIARFSAAGLLDDGSYAEMRAGSLHRRGFSKRGIEQALRAKGVSAPDIRGALDRIAEDAVDPELEAAIAYARRRRLGPFRSPEARALARDKDMAALARRGFSFEVARRVLHAADEAELEALLAQGSP